MKNILSILIGIAVILSCAEPLKAEAGMIPLSELNTLNLQEKGLDIPQKMIFDAGDESLINAIVKVNGCTGSFISDQGLILTNHHCAYRAIQNASTADMDYLKHGFSASSIEEEIPATGYEVRITLRYKDISDSVLIVVKPDMTPLERSKAIEKRQKILMKKAEKKHKGKRAEISEMFIGKTYYIFIYEYLKDVRLAYAPPKSIGNFGGEIDNWMWPRHTGDFSILRVYTAPDGSSANYSEDNIPYKPKKILKIKEEEVKSGDFAFILGYPGRTFRNRPAAYLNFTQSVQLPFIKELYEKQIDILQTVSEQSPETALKLASRIKGRSNTEKNYRGKLLGLKRTNLESKWIQTDKMLKKYLADNPSEKNKYGNLLEDLELYYTDRKSDYIQEQLTYRLLSNVILLNIANTLCEYSIEKEKEDIERKSKYMDRNIERTFERLYLGLNDYIYEADREIFADLITRYFEHSSTYPLPELEIFLKGKSGQKSVYKFIDKAYKKSKLNDRAMIDKLKNMSREELEKEKDPLLRFALSMQPWLESYDNSKKERKGRLDALMADYVELRKTVSKQNFIPDANSTLRLTYGKIEGYSPADALWAEPITRVRGLLEKDRGQSPFNLPDKIKQAIHSNPDLLNTPVALLYSMDTTGGNSGSPVLDSYGNLIGLNFDRAFEATINDYAWDYKYSRSIGVSISYVLWIIDLYNDNGSYILNEINI